VIGRTLSHYEILEEVSRGGMGVVYRARDIKLDRDVALKVLPPELVRDEVRKRRFITEAKAAAKLQHPAIAVVYEIDDADGWTFIAMELISGIKLGDVLAREKLSVHRCLELSVEIVEGLAGAHEKGIIHRDLKPANIMVTVDGHAKIIDFGLAKLFEAGEPGDSEGHTRVKGDTEAGQILGTVAYMSPEQARGQRVDPRTDIFSFGIVFYEMLTGEAPFQGPSGAETMSAIINNPTPPLAPAVKGPMVAALTRVVERCLEKAPEDRYQTAKDLASELRRGKRDSESGARVSPAAPEPRRPSSSLQVLGIAAIAGFLAAAYFLWPGRETRPGGGFPAAARFSQLTSLRGREMFPSLSPDGRSLVYVARESENDDLYLLRVGGENAINLTKDSEAHDTQPRFSPDGESIAFRSERQGGGIFIMGATGESVRRLTDHGFNPSWSPDSREIVFATESVIANPRARNMVSKLWIVSVESGQVKELPVPDGVQPHWSANGQRIAYWTYTGGQRDIWTVPARGGKPVAVTHDLYLDWNPIWSPDGRYLYFSSDRGGTMNLWRVSIEETSGSALGAPEPVTTGVSAEPMHLSISSDGKRIAYASEARTTNIMKVSLDPEKLGTGEPVFVTEGSLATTAADVSPDGTWLTYYRQGVQEDIFISRSDGTGTRQLTQDAFYDRGPRWSPDGSKIAFYSNRSGRYQIWTIHPDGSGLSQVSDDPREPIYPAWSPDGKRLAVSDLATGSFILSLAESGAAALTPLPPLGEGEYFVSQDWSPDGNWIAGGQRVTSGVIGGIVVHSLESSRYERLTDFGDNPAWMGDSGTLLFNDEGKIFAVDRKTRKPRLVLSAPPDRLQGPAVSRDGRTLYYTLIHDEADLWLIQIEDPGT